MSDKKTDSKSVREYVNISEKEWLSISLALVALSVVGVVFAFVWVFALTEDPAIMQQKASALSPFGLALFALVTFCTVAWRGVISTRQANESEYENRARLLQEGANLISKEEATLVSTGLATLELLVSGSERRFGIQAMNIVADYIQDRFRNNHRHKLFKQASVVLRTGFKNGILSDRSLLFSSVNPDMNWEKIVGVKNVKYQGGIIRHWKWKYLVNNKSNYSFQKVVFKYVRDLSIDYNFNDCSFINCSVKEVSDDIFSDHLKVNIYSECNFSGCVFEELTGAMTDLRGGLNYFDCHNPPILMTGIGDRPIDWADFLVIKDNDELVNLTKAAFQRPFYIYRLRSCETSGSGCHFNAGLAQRNGFLY